MKKWNVELTWMPPNVGYTSSTRINVVAQTSAQATVYAQNAFPFTVVVSDLSWVQDIAEGISVVE